MKASPIDLNGPASEAAAAIVSATSAPRDPLSFAPVPAGLPAHPAARSATSASAETIHLDLRFTAVVHPGLSGHNLNDNIGGFDRGRRQLAGLEFELIGSLAGHERNDPVGPGINLDQRSYLVPLNPGDDPG